MDFMFDLGCFALCLRSIWKLRSSCLHSACIIWLREIRFILAL